MKYRLILALASLAASFRPQAQNVPNPSFDSVYFGGIDRLFEWITADGFRMAAGANWLDTVNGLVPNATYPGGGFQFHELLWLNNRSDTSSLSLASTVLINRPHFKKQDGSAFPGFLMAGNSLKTDAQGYPDYRKCGIPFSARPQKLVGYYHFVDSTGSLSNAGKCYLLLKKWNPGTGMSDTVGFVQSTMQLGPTAAFTPFQLNITYMSSAQPDSLVLVFEATTNPQLAAALWLDELSFVYSGIGMPEDHVNTVLLYPNPVVDRVFVRPEGNYAYRIFSATGQLLANGHCTTSISLAALRPQWLYIELRDEHQNIQHVKICKQP